MTQLLLFDYPTTATTSVASPLPAASPVPVTCPSSERFRTSAAPQQDAAAEASPATPLLSGSLPLHEPGKGELHRIGDLAQLVLARYEIVHRRRAARLRRAPSGRGIASQSRI